MHDSCYEYLLNIIKVLFFFRQLQLFVFDRPVPDFWAGGGRKTPKASIATGVRMGRGLSSLSRK